MFIQITRKNSTFPIEIENGVDVFTEIQNDDDMTKIIEKMLTSNLEVWALMNKKKR